MSEQSISDKSQIIRNETQQHANTRGRVADVIDDINATKANKTDVTDVEGDISAHLGDFNNPHNVTKTQVGLGNADNTSDLDKPISNAVQAELDDIRTDIQGQTDWNVAQDIRLDQLEQHNIEQDTALVGKANTDASNISTVNAELWRKKLNVPQIPDSVISKGEVTADSSTVYLALPLTGKNAVLIDGQTYERTDPQSFPFTPVTTGEKILIVYAKPDSQVFHLAQGAESAEAIEPSYNGLFVARILVNSSGAVVTENNDDDFKTKVDDTVYPIIINVEAGIWVYARFNTFEVLNNSTATTPILFGLISDGASATVWNGKRFYIKNSSGKNLTLKKEPTPPIVGDTVYFSFSKNITLKDGETIVLFLNRSNEFEPLKFIGGSASFPETGNNGDILEKDSAEDGGVKWSNRLTTAENEIDTEIVNRALADALKLDKPTAPNNIAERVINADGSTSPKGNFSRTLQVEVGSNTTAQEDWKGKLILVTASCTITIPATLSDSWAVDVATLTGATLTLAITTPKQWLFGTPAGIPEKSICTIAQRGNTNSIALFGL